MGRCNRHFSINLTIKDMTKITYIPSRIKNVAVGGHVVGAGDIMEYW
jgi:hypothetical protein